MACANLEVMQCWWTPLLYWRCGENEWCMNACTFLHADPTSKAILHGKQYPRPSFNKTKPHNFPLMVEVIFSFFIHCLGPILSQDEGNNAGLWHLALLFLPPFLWTERTQCAACVFSALVWIGHIWHSCALVNAFLNSAHLENLPCTSSAVLDTSHIECTYMSVHTHMHTHTQTDADIYMNIYTYTHTHIYIHKQIHAG